jgi:hypothetical protein
MSFSEMDFLKKINFKKKGLFKEEEDEKNQV